MEVHGVWALFWQKDSKTRGILSLFPGLVLIWRQVQEECMPVCLLLQTCSQTTWGPEGPMVTSRPQTSAVTS